jgi:high affinity sulfate transporter 1
MLELVPPSLRGYQSSWLRADVLAGLTLVAIAVPEQLATARLVGVPPVLGLYAFLAGTLVFALFGSHRLLSVGADSTIAPILAAGASALAVPGGTHYVALMAPLAVLVGVLVAAVGVARLGWTAQFLSAPAVSGVLAGIAVQIVVHQLPAALGVPSGGTDTLDQLRVLVGRLDRVNLWSVAVAVAVFAVALVAERIDRRIPGPLVGILVALGAVSVFGLTARGVQVLGPIGPARFSMVPPLVGWADLAGLAGPALIVAFVCLVQTSAVLRTGGGSADTVNRDLVALGLGSVAAGLVGTFAVNSSPPRTEVVRASGGRTQLAGVVSVVVVLVVLGWATGPLRDLPQAALAAVLIFVAARMFRFPELVAIWRFDRLEFAMAVLALLVVAFVGIEQGVVAAMLLALADRTRRTARPRDAVLGREPGTDHWIPSDIGRVTEYVPGVLVYQSFAPLWYADADYVYRRVRRLLDDRADPTTHNGSSPGANDPGERLRGLVFDLSGMPDVDYTGARMLGELATDLRSRGIALAIARSSHTVRHDLKHSGLLTDIGPEHLFTSVQDAVEALTRAG